jgi:hypothetical protein
VPTDYMDTDDSQQLLGWFEGTVLDSYWSTSRIESQGKATFDGADTYKLFWHVRVDDVLQEYDKMVPPSMSVSMGMGEGWLQDPDNKNIVRHEDDPGDEAVEAGRAKPIRFKGSSLLGKFAGLCTGKYESYYTQTAIDPLVDDLVVLDDGPELEYDLAGVRGNFTQRGVIADPRDASIWTGMRFLFRGVGFVYRQTRGTPGFRATPFVFLGYDPEASDSAPSSTESASSAGPVVEPSDVALALPEGTDEKLVGQLTDMVNSSKTHTAFMRLALKLPEVKGNEEVKAKVMDAEAGPFAVKEIKTAEES